MRWEGVILVLIILTPVLAQAENEVTPENGFFYFFDRLGESFSLFFTFDAEARAELEKSLANERLNEAEILAGKNGTGSIVKSLVEESIDISERNGFTDFRQRQNNLIMSDTVLSEITDSREITDLVNRIGLITNDTGVPQSNETGSPQTPAGPSDEAPLTPETTGPEVIAGPSTGLEAEVELQVIESTPTFSFNKKVEPSINLQLTDSDSDGLSDYLENQQGTNPEINDTDGDGLDDELEISIGTDPMDPDTDSDGLTDGKERSRLVYQLIQLKRNQLARAQLVLRPSAGVSDLMIDLPRHGQASDGSWATNPLDPDTDDDGWSDGLEVREGTNPLDPDTDDDGLKDGAEGLQSVIAVSVANQELVENDLEIGVAPVSEGPDTSVTLPGTDPLDPDSDNDGLMDGLEGFYNANPLKSDTDGDGLSDGREVRIHTNPANSDTDGDGVSDYEEIRQARNPLVAEYLPPLIDGKVVDTEALAEEILSEFPLGEGDLDGDGLNNSEEAWLGDPGGEYDTGVQYRAVLSGELVEVSGRATIGTVSPDISDDVADVRLQTIHLKTNPLERDTDADGLDDNLEYLMGLNPLDRDFDSDGLADSAEIKTVFRYTGSYENGSWISLDTGDGLKGYGWYGTATGFDCSEVTRAFDTPDGKRVYYKEEGSPKRNQLLSTGRVRDLVSNAGSVSVSKIGELALSSHSNLASPSIGLVTDEESVEESNPLTIERLDNKTVYIVPPNADPCAAVGAPGFPEGVFDEIKSVEAVSNGLVDAVITNEIQVYKSPLLGGNHAGYEALIVSYPLINYSGMEVYNNFTNPFNNDTDGDGLLDYEELKVTYRTNAMEGEYDYGTSIAFGTRLLKPYFYEGTVIVGENDTYAFMIDTPEGYPLYQEGNRLYLFKEVGYPNLDGDVLHEYLYNEEITNEDFVNITPSLNYGKREVYLPITGPLNPDVDSDGVSDGNETGMGLDPLNPDTDNDGVLDGAELLIYTLPDNPDTDGDGIIDGDELRFGTYPLSTDSDQDTLSDYEEYYNIGSNPLSNDTDNDGLLDAEEIELGTNLFHYDTDGDRIDDYDEVYVTFTNPANNDTDGDGLSDSQEDKDMDGTVDLPVVECINMSRSRSLSSETNPLNPDTDGDGIDDGTEREWGLYPQCNDTDLDGLSDGDELNIWGTLANNTDSDGDLFCANINDPECEPIIDYVFPSSSERCYGYDGEEVALGYDPAVMDSDSADETNDGRSICNNTRGDLDPDMDGLNNSYERELGTDIMSRDTDGDGLFDGDEVMAGLKPLSVDSDGDHVNDADDLDPLNIVNKVTWLKSFPKYTVDTKSSVRVITLPDTSFSKVELTKHKYRFCVHRGESTRDLGNNDMIIGEPSDVTDYLDTINENFYEDSDYTIRDYDVFSRQWITQGTRFGSGSCIYRNVFEFIIDTKARNFYFNLTNSNPLAINDSEGQRFRIMHEEFKPVPGQDQDLIIQYSFRNQGDDLTNEHNDLLFSLKLFKDSSCPSASYNSFSGECLEEVYATSAPAVKLGANAYQVTLPIKGEFTGGSLYLQIKPVWVNRSGNITQTAFNPEKLQIASFANRVYYDAVSVYVKCNETENCNNKMVNALNLLPYNVTDTYVVKSYFGDIGWQVFRNSTLSYELDDDTEIVVIIDSSPLGVAEIEDKVFGDEPEGFVYSYTDGLNNLTGKHKVDFVKKVTYAYSDLASGGDLANQPPVPNNTKVNINARFGEGVDNLLKVNSSGIKYQVLTVESNTSSGSIDDFHLVKAESKKTSSSLISTAESLLTKDNFNTFEGLVSDYLPYGDVGSVLVTDGLDAVMAFKEGDNVRGTFASVKAGIGLAGIGAEAVLLKQGSKAAGKVGPVAQAAVGLVDAGYNIYKAASSDDPFEQKKNLEMASATLIDTAVALIPYGYVVDPTWQLTIGAISYFVPNRLAEKACASLGSGVTFTVQYYSGDVPTAMSEEATLCAGETIVERVEEENKDVSRGESSMIWMYLPPS